MREQVQVDVNGVQALGFKEVHTEEVPCGWCDTTQYFDAETGGTVIRQDIAIRVREGLMSELMHGTLGG